MTPYYADDLVTLYHGDCREILPTLADESVAAVITDPPYTQRTHDKARTNRGHGGQELVDFAAISDDDLRGAMVECGRVSAGWVVATLDYRHAVAFEALPPTGLRMLRVGVWVKPSPMPQLTGDRPGQGWESIAFLHRADRRSVWNGGGRSSVWVHEHVRDGVHPTAKPVQVVGDWVRLFTNHGGIVLDPFAGSGTTLRAAVDNGRKAVGVEVEERYCEVIARRLAQGALDFGAAS